MNGVTEPEHDYSEFVEVDPTGRYGRYNEILGKGASKTVYRAFDEYEGIEVAWNQVKLYDFLQSPQDLERLYCEIHLLKTLKHDNIMKFYTSWVDTTKRNINFVTEMFTSGTLRQYRLKHRRVNIRAIKHWCRQILKGLLYLHSHDPPVIHRDLKCDNIFVNGNQGEVKLGDLGLAAILRKSHAAHCVGTPEFMAPEIYDEEYNELVDIYSFGMCILEMVTFEYPYSECTHPAQIYKKVVSGKKPDALYKVEDLEVRRFVEKCLATASLRLPAKELLMDPFLQTNDYGLDLKSIAYRRDCEGVSPLLREPLFEFHSCNSSFMNGYPNYIGWEHETDMGYHPDDFEQFEHGGIDLFDCHEEEHLENVDITIKGKRREDDGIFLRLRISDKEGRIRNIYFPFDIHNDTALSVATEMVAELDITDQDVTKIAEMIDGEIATLVPGWKSGLSIDENPSHPCATLCHNCASNGYLLDYVAPNTPGTKNLQVLQCSRHGCAAVHGRFEEITYQVDGSEQFVTEGVHVISSQSNGLHYTDVWALRDAPELSSPGSREIHSDEEHVDHEALEKDERVINIDNQSEPSRSGRNSFVDDYENEIRQELRWLKAKYQIQLQDLRDQPLRVKSKPSRSSPNSDCASTSPVSTPTKEDKHLVAYFPVNGEKISTTMGCYPGNMLTAKSFFAAGALLPVSLNRATSLPVDAVDI